MEKEGSWAGEMRRNRFHTDSYLRGTWSVASVVYAHIPRGYRGLWACLENAQLSQQPQSWTSN